MHDAEQITETVTNSPKQPEEIGKDVADEELNELVQVNKSLRMFIC